MRIAMFTDTYAPQMNGVARTLARWSTAMAARGNNVRVFTTTAPDSGRDAAVTRYASIPFWAYKEMRLAWPGAAIAMRDLKSWRPDVVHAATPFGVGLAARAAARSLRIPLVTSYHTQLVQYAAHYGLTALQGAGVGFLRWFHNSGRCTFVPTRAIADELTELGMTNLRVWGRGVDPRRFHPGFRSESLRAKMKAAPASVVVAYVGRIAPEKGVDIAAKAMDIVNTLRPGTVFAFGGDGPAEAWCRALAPRNTYFAGRLDGDALSSFYASADIFVFPSATDTFGNVLTEAMSSRLAVVAVNVPQSREVVGEEAGEFVAPSSPESMARAIVRLIDDRSLLEERRLAALERARSMTWDDVFDQLLLDYRSIAGIPARAAAAYASGPVHRAENAVIR